MRVYHDSSIKSTIKCDLECLKDETGNLINNVDFCNVENMFGHQNPQFNHGKWLEKNTSSQATWSGIYIHAFIWRWFPIGDLFVNVFSSRDADAKILQREVDSVNVWLNSNKVGHIMRGNYKNRLR